MKIGRCKLLWIIFFVWTVLVVNTVCAQEGRRRYIYRDYNSEGTVFSQHSVSESNIMPASAAERSTVQVKPFNEPGFDGSGTCIRLTFSNLREPPKWAGVVLPVQASYWGERPEASSSSVLDLRSARRLVFYARGEKGGERIQVKAAFASDKPYGDSALVPVMKDWITLERDWRRYDVLIDNPAQLERVITPFAVITSLSYNPGGAITVYLDEIYYELGN